MIVIQADAADQELLVYLSDHRAGAAGLTLGHNEGHSKDTVAAQVPLNLEGRERKRDLLKRSFTAEEGVITSAAYHGPWKDSCSVGNED